MKQQKKSVNVSVDFHQHNHGTNEKLKKQFNLFAIYGDCDKYVKLVHVGSRREILDYLFIQFNHLSFDNNVLVALSRDFFSCFNSMPEYYRYSSDLHYLDYDGNSCVAFARIDGVTVKFVVTCLK